MTGSTQPPKPFVHSLGDTSWVLLRANPAPGTQRARTLSPPSRKHSQHLPSLAGGEAGCCPTTVGQGTSSVCSESMYSIDSAVGGRDQ